MSVSPWVPKIPSLTLTTDASDWGWGYQSSEGHQRSGVWKKSVRIRHISVRELYVVIKALCMETSPRYVNSNSLGQCCHCLLYKQTRLFLLEDTPRSIRDLCFWLWGSIFFTQYEVDAASHLEGRKNQWADALWRQTTPSVEWALDREVFLKLAQMYDHPQIDLFASWSNHRIKWFLTRTGDSRRGSRCFSGRLEQMTVNIPVPPPLTIRLRVINHLRTYKGKVLLITPLWEAQPWTQDLLH